VVSNNRLRGELDTALAALKLLSARRGSAPRKPIKALQASGGCQQAALAGQSLANEQDPGAQGTSCSCCAPQPLLGSTTDAAKRLAAASALGDSAQADTKTLLIERLQAGNGCGNVKAATANSLRTVEAAPGLG